ncbi:MAG: translocation/assembly module TamB domain-containing protein [Hyphomonadaceae bacterium]|nr:translocation/assembly module TamB domain-containing protein [Hyphomonadaceae bacterium]
MSRRIWIAAAAGTVMLVGAGGYAIGPGAPWLVDQLADGQRVWRLGRIHIDGVSGAWLGDLRAAHVTIGDEHGVWLEANNITLRWRPQDFPFGSVRIDGARAEQIEILRRPSLTPARPPGPTRLDVHLTDLQVEALRFDEPVFGVPARFSAMLDLDVEERRIISADARLERTDSDADRFAGFYKEGDNFALNVDLFGEAGGVFARALGVPDQSVSAHAASDGTGSAGEATLTAAIGSSPLVEGEVRWTPSGWQAQGGGRLELLPSLRTLGRRIGTTFEITASGAHVGAFEARATTPLLVADLTGVRDGARRLEGPARFTITTDRLSAIARESPFEMGAARLEGELRHARGTTAIQATLDAQSIDALGETARFSGPVRAALTEQRFTLEADLRAPETAGPLFSQGHLRTDLAYDRARRRFSLDRAELNSGAIAVSAQGWAAGGDGEFSGEWRVRKLEALILDLTGEASGRWRAFADQNGSAHVWAASVSGTGAHVAGEPDVLAQMLGATPRLDGRFRFESRDVIVEYARIDGARLRAGARGALSRGQADLALEASARGPLSVGGAEIAGAADARGRLTGRLSRPALSAEATLARFSASGVVVDQPIVSFTLAPASSGYVGQADIRGLVSGQPMTASSPLTIDRGALRLPNLTASLAGLRAQGDVTVADAGVSASLDLSGRLDGVVAGVTGAIDGRATLAPSALLLDARISDARSGALFVRAATIHAEGPYETLAARIDLRGRLGQAPLTFAGAGTVAEMRGERTVRVDGRGTLAGVDVFTRAPIEARFDRATANATLNVAIGDGVITADWRERGRRLAGTAVLNDAPLAPIAAVWGERAEGVIDGRLALASDGPGLRGDADVMLNDARVASRQDGRLNARIRAQLTPTRLHAALDATSTDGLVAAFEADAPVLTSAAPIRIALAPERRGRATWSVRGPAASLWAAARLPDQSLQGQLNGEGALSFGAGYLAGDGAIEIADGRFEDKLTGVSLEQLNARVALTPGGVTIERFAAIDGHGGRLSASGGSANEREGRITVRVENMRIADRPDARARASGDLTLAWEGAHSTLSGDLNVADANLDIAANPEAGIPTIDVIEINRPDQEDETPEASDAARARNGSTTLDVRLRAPGRVFTRGRGVDAEWALDLRLAGTARAPRLFGEARAVRGMIALSGAPFVFEDALITFSGDPLEAQIDLRAARETADLTAYLNLTGTARDPDVSFTSDPGLPEDEILPQVLFGRSVEDLSAFEAAQLAASLAALTGQASLDLMGAARAAVGLDRFNVRQDEENGGFLVAGGVYLTRDVYVEVARTGLGQAQSRVEWTMRPKLVLITSFLANGDRSVSLRWRRESD